MIALSLLALAVVMPAQIEVDEGAVTAADLIGEAAVSVGDVHRMSQVGLGRAPVAGQSRRIAGPYLRRLLRAAGVKRVRVPAQILLIGRAEVISAKAQISAIRRFLVKRLGKAGTIESIRAHQNVEAVKVPPGSRIARVRPVGHNPFAERVTFRLEIERRGQIVSRRYPQVLIEGSAPVMVARRSLPARRVIEAGSIQREVRNLARVKPGSLGYFNVSGMLAARRIPAGSVITRSDLKAPAVVHRGQRIRIELRASSVSVSTAGEALGDAAVGQMVTVRNLRSGRRLQGRVRAPGLVEVNP
jgi:flagella basal body P-ring formation protein FlgA